MAKVVKPIVRATAVPCGSSAHQITPRWSRQHEAGGGQPATSSVAADNSRPSAGTMSPASTETIVLGERHDAPDPRDEQHDLHRVVVLALERAPARLALGFRELVRPVLLEARRGFFGRKSACGVDLHRGGDGVAGKLV